MTESTEGLICMPRKLPRTLLVSFLLVGAAKSYGMNLQEYLKNVEANHKTVKSLDISKEAADDRQVAGDIDLVPTMGAGVSYTSDKSPLSQFALFGVSETKTTSYNLGFNKKFSTGTSAKIWAGTSQIENVGIQDPQLAAYEKFGFGQMGISLSQSLWKDFFGAATRLRWERQDAATAAEKGSYDLQKRGLLVQAESAYWEYLYAIENLKTAQGSLERARKIESWTRRRVNDGISDRADLLQGQALVAGRQLALITAEDELETAKQAVRDYLEIPKTAPFPMIEGDINVSRPINTLVTGGQGRVVQVEAYLQSLDAKARSVVAEEVDDAYRPDLVLTGDYTTNTLKKDMPEATQNLTDTTRPTAKIALNFTYMFDTSVKSATRNAARKEALAARLQAERKLIDSDSSWSELNRQYQEMTKRVEAASQLQKLQTDRARATNELFNKGRTITMNVVDAENDAATAELNLSRLKSLQRKMEAQGRLYMTVEE
ncbi:TolC family protein [Bdellovibrio sp. HCB209]|uniref:TolC family protein n=1 Tax=Bdellovibrio sp. HCB209 TaxID=3394354 RepID=UPI0039B68C43